MPLVNQVFDPEPAESVSLTQFPDAVNGLGNRMPFDLLDGSPLHDFLDVPIKLQAASLRLSSKLGFDFGLQLNLDHRFYPPSSGNTTFREYDFMDPPPLFYSLRTVMGWMLNRPPTFFAAFLPSRRASMWARRKRQPKPANG
jgi:hypothetical protein